MHCYFWLIEMHSMNKSCAVTFVFRRNLCLNQLPGILPICERLHERILVRSICLRIRCMKTLPANPKTSCLGIIFCKPEKPSS